MNVQILETHSFVAEVGLYETICFDCEGQKVTVTNFTGKHSSKVNVTVHNATQKAFRGLGKDFDTIEKALEHYKSNKIRAALNTAFYIKGNPDVLNKLGH
jgi:hypothetical protein